jgi:ubiquitin carboxyl-terminal hydrolase 22/27/51
MHSHIPMHLRCIACVGFFGCYTPQERFFHHRCLIIIEESGFDRAGDVDCRCIVHRVFSGLLRSDVTCTVCGFTSTTYDPCVDISLDLEPDFGTEKGFTESIINGEYGGRTSRAASSALGASTLLGCLDRFTRPERLGTNEKFFCQRCQTRQESIKQMSIRKVPLVLCFHIKRFEHSTSRNTSRKVDRYVQFPFFLDLLPYLSSSIVRLRHGNRLLSLDPPPSPCSSEFELFAVVTHSGKLDSGHYVSFLRLNNSWYKCDDAWITRVSEDYVRASQAYMLYYVQKTLFYKASDTARG